MTNNLFYINQFYLNTNHLCHPATGNYAEAKYDFIFKLSTRRFQIKKGDSAVCGNRYAAPKKIKKY